MPPRPTRTPPSLLGRLKKSERRAGNRRGIEAATSFGFSESDYDTSGVDSDYDSEWEQTWSPLPTERDGCLTFTSKLCATLALVVVGLLLMSWAGGTFSRFLSRGRLRSGGEPAWMKDRATIRAMLALEKSAGSELLAGAAAQHRAAVASAVSEFLDVEERLNGVSAPAAEAELADIVRSVVAEEMSSSSQAAPRQLAARAFGGAVVGQRERRTSAAAAAVAEAVGTARADARATARAEAPPLYDPAAHLRGRERPAWGRSRR
mgnify:FL=1